MAPDLTAFLAESYSLGDGYALAIKEYATGVYYRVIPPAGGNLVRGKELAKEVLGLTVNPIDVNNDGQSRMAATPGDVLSAVNSAVEKLPKIPLGDDGCKLVPKNYGAEGICYAIYYPGGSTLTGVERAKELGIELEKKHIPLKKADRWIISADKIQHIIHPSVDLDLSMETDNSGRIRIALDSKTAPLFAEQIGRMFVTYGHSDPSFSFHSYDKSSVYIVSVPPDRVAEAVNDLSAKLKDAGIKEVTAKLGADVQNLVSAENLTAQLEGGVRAVHAEPAKVRG